MALVELRDAIVSSIQSEISGFKTVQAHGGRMTVDELKRYAMKSPAAIVVMMGGPHERHGGQPVMNAEYVVFVITGGSSVTPRGDAAAVLAEAIVNLANDDHWNIENARAPNAIDSTNLYSGKLDELSIAMWGISWKQLIDVTAFSAEDFAALDDFYRLNVKTDMAPADGVIDSEQMIELGGTLMSVYGLMNISTAAATSIAAPGTFQKAAGTTELLEDDSFDMPENNRLRHTGSTARPCLIRASLSVEVGGDAKVSAGFAVNGVIDEDSVIEQQITAAGGPEAFSLDTVKELGEDDYVEIWLTADSTVNVTLTKANVVAAGV